MAARDYTDGGGWAKLDQTACAQLARIIARFPPKYSEKYTLMLLTLYRSMTNDGVISIGYRTLAERAGVTRQSAERFVTKLESDGELVKVGEVSNNGGRYTMRRFEWMEGDSVNRVTPDSKSRRNRVTPDSKSPGKSSHIRTSKKFSEGGGGSATAAPPPTFSEDYHASPLLKIRTDM